MRGDDDMKQLHEDEKTRQPIRSIHKTISDIFPLD